MADSRGTGDRQIARAAVLALHHAAGCLRQHPDNQALQRAALRKCVDAMQAATAHGVLAIALRADAACVGDEVVLPFAPTEPPFGPLRHAGIGELALLPGCTSLELANLVRHLAHIAHDGDPERMLHALLTDPALSHVQLHAAAASPHAAPDQATDWSHLPAPPAADPALASLVARDLASNLPAITAQQLFDDLEGVREDTEPMLAGLLARMLERCDLATASWLLAETEHREHLGAGMRDRLRAQAARRADEPWLAERLEHGTRDELMSLTAFVMQLPDSVGARYAELLSANSHPFSRWLCELLQR